MIAMLKVKILNLQPITMKAVEYFIKERMDKDGIGDAKFVHLDLLLKILIILLFMSIKDALENTYQPAIDSLIKNLEILSNQWSSIPMFAKTHGQPASPTNLGKEIYGPLKD